MEFFYLCIWLLSTETPHDRNRVWIGVFVCSSFPCLLHSFDACLLSFESPWIDFFTFEFWFGFFHPWCPFVWVIISFISWTEKNLWAIPLFTDSCFHYIFLSRKFDSLILLALICGMGLFWIPYTCLSYFLPVGPLLWYS